MKKLLFILTLVLIPSFVFAGWPRTIDFWRTLFIISHSKCNVNYVIVNENKNIESNENCFLFKRIWAKDNDIFAYIVDDYNEFNFLSSHKETVDKLRRIGLSKRKKMYLSWSFYDNDFSVKQIVSIGNLENFTLSSKMNLEVYYKSIFETVLKEKLKKISVEKLEKVLDTIEELKWKYSLNSNKYIQLKVIHDIINEYIGGDVIDIDELFN